MYHYVYRITNKILNKHYYGVRSSKTLPEDDLGIKYFSSSKDKDFLKDQKENKHNFKYKIVMICKSRVDILRIEVKLHDKFNVGVNESFYNKAKQTSVGFDTTGKANYFSEDGVLINISIEEANKRKLVAQNKGIKPSQETINKQIAGRVGSKRSEETKRKMSAWQKGKPKWDNVGKKKLSDIHKGKILTDEHKRNISESGKGVPKPKVECPHCRKLCPAHLVHRYHFDNCKINETPSFDRIMGEIQRVIKSIVKVC